MDCVCQKLELKIMPVTVFIISALLMITLTFLFPSLMFDFSYRLWLAGLVFFGGGILILSGIHAFKKANTTKTPNTPEETKTLVIFGVYRFTRNPMYLGGAMISFSCALLIGNFAAFLSTLFFVSYITQFQIKPEERILLKKFPEQFMQYTARTRRWL